jgi:glycosyltransferase involved in cell wall biosynthesis
MQARVHAMNVTMLMDGFGIGGTELNATRTLEAFARRDVSITVMHFHADGELKSRVAAAGHRLIHVPIVPLTSPRIASRVWNIARALRATRSELVHTQDVYSNILGTSAGMLVPGLPVLTSRRWKDEVPRRGFMPLNAWAHRRSTVVLPNSPALIPTLLSEGVRDDRIHVHENFVDDSALQVTAPSERLAARATFGIPPGALVIGYVARLTRVKRHDILIDAFAQLADEVPNAYLMLVGDGDLRASLEAQVAQRGVAERTKFTGTLPNAPLPHRLFDIAVLTSENEGFPNSVVEASACGIPVVATAVGGVPDVLVDGITGVSIPVADVRATAGALRSLLRDEPLRHRMGAAGRDRVTTRFSESAAVERLLKIYADFSRHR